MAESRACTREGMWAFISSQLELLKVIERGEIKESATKPNAKTYFARKVLERLNDKEIWVQREVCLLYTSSSSLVAAFSSIETSCITRRSARLRNFLLVATTSTIKLS